MGIDAFRLLIRQTGDSGIKLFICNLAFVYFAGGYRDEQCVMLNTIASVKRVMGLIPVFAALIRSFITRVGQEHGGNFVRHLNKAIGGIIRVVVPKIDR